jgi:segregation and condensation protein B
MSEFPALKQIIEGAILASDRPLSIDAMISLFEGEQPTRAQVRETLVEIETECDGRGFELKEVASGYRFQVREDYGEWVGRLWEERPPRYTRALLETLALIAYKQPITRGDIEEIRGVAVSTNIIRTLLEREWIRVVGHRDVPGRPAIYATTKTFLDYFNLSSLDELPTLSEIKDLEKVNEELDLDDEELIVPPSLEMRLEEGDEATGMNEAELDEVTNTVNTIQANIRNLFATDQDADGHAEEGDELDDETDDETDVKAQAGAQSDTVESSEVNDDGKQ